MSEFLGGFGVEGEVVAGEFFAGGDIADGDGGDGRLRVRRSSGVGLRGVVHEAAEVPAQDIGANRFIPKSEPADVLAGQFWKGSKAFRGDGLIKTGLKAPKGGATRDCLGGEQAHAMDGTGSEAGFDQQHATRVSGLGPRVNLSEFQAKTCLTLTTQPLDGGPFPFATEPSNINTI